MLLCGKYSLICKRFKYIGCKFSVCGKQLSCETPQNGIRLAWRALIMATEVEDNNAICSILHMLNDFGADDALALMSVCQYKVT